ncbi:MAG: PHP domain-containing protein [Gammaproteobacteria bacterium]|nr:PHP domain-containing protein [Gammaproteobacteria bacterium]MDX2487330.1 PHP domain-containing protein [Gammaproteobacteria bacterium]
MKPATISADLHCHSTASDGTLPPAKVVTRAAANGVDMLALTDHDTTAGLDEAYLSAQENNIRLIAGIELSVTWQGKLLHIVGLDIDPEYRPLRQGIRMLKEMREERAQEMGKRLARAGYNNAYENARRLAGNGNITRTHFARHLIEVGAAKDFTDVFKRFLVRGKPGYYRVDWAPMEDAINWITDSGGVAVVAHPMRYKLTASWLNRVIAGFREAGGKGIEVVCGHNSADDNARSAMFARKHGLLASQGSDFHEPGKWVELGKLAKLPDGIEPVWQQWL